MRKWATLIVVLGLAAYGLAQRGGGHRNAGAANHASVGASEMGRGNSHTAGTPSLGSSVSKQSPDTALTKSPKLSSNLEKLLPSGMTAQQACSGFKNLGQCMAAIHVAHNLDIPFADLKAKMTGTDSASLGKAIQTLKPAANAKAETKKAQKQADQDLSENDS